MKSKVLITIEGGIIQNISTSTSDIQLVVIDYDKHAEETVSIYEYKPDTTFNRNSNIIFENMDINKAEETTIHVFLKSIDF